MDPMPGSGVQTEAGVGDLGESSTRHPRGAGVRGGNSYRWSESCILAQPGERTVEMRFSEHLGECEERSQWDSDRRPYQARGHRQEKMNRWKLVLLVGLLITCVRCDLMTHEQGPAEF